MKFAIKSQVEERTMFDKCITHMKEMQRKLKEDEKIQRKEQEKKDVTLAKHLEKEDAPTKRVFKKRKVQDPEKTYMIMKKGKK